ncbi:hypothetical protein CMV_003462 [Castanea mollissima]|uniref:Zinc finger PHD-type domain-containing protein n=1 Tax=Castanea mollissima TaxID=60419 RepID=A0A8J4RVW4_9ROSI|nr:hypothetical protein CMV_003462 [Castanea mollissima]
MRPNVTQRQVESCEICGGDQYREKIVLCNNCYTRQHIYCMQVYHPKVPRDWVCELCLSGDTVLPEAGVKEDKKRSMHTEGPSSGWQANSKRQKPIPTGKVKYMPTAEVIKLSSAPQKVSPLQMKFGPRSGPSCFTASSQSNPVGFRTATPKSSNFRVQANPRLGPSGLMMKPPRFGSVQLNSAINKQAPQVSKTVEGNEALLACKKELVIEEVDALIHDTKIQKNVKVDALIPDKKIQKNTVMTENEALLASKMGRVIEKVDALIPDKKIQKNTVMSGNEALLASKKELVIEKVDALTPNTKIQKNEKVDALIPDTKIQKNMVMSGNEALLASKKELVIEKVNAPIPYSKIPKNEKVDALIPDTQIQKNMRQSTWRPIPKGGKFQAFFKRENSDAEESELLNSLPKFKLYRDYLPALHATWRGSILVAAKPGDIYRGLLAQIGDIYHGLRAQPPRTVSGRAYELSLRLPLTLRVMLLPRSQIWADLFQNDYPDLNDIALYFSPDDKIERSKESISCLSELMEDENVILRICIEGVDLLIFTAKQLHVDSQNVIARLEAGYVLWGIFLPVKHNQTQEPARVGSSIGVASTSVIDKYRYFLGDIKAGSESFSLRTKTSPTVYTLSQS